MSVESQSVVSVEEYGECCETETENALSAHERHAVNKWGAGSGPRPPLKRQRLVNHDDDTSVVVIFPTAMPTSIPTSISTPVTRIAIVAIRSSIVARTVIVVWIRIVSIAAVMVGAPPAAQCLADVADFFRM